MGNKLLAALPDEEYKHILPYLELATFSFGENIYEISEQPDYAYYPTTLVVSLISIMTNGASVEIGVVGNEGVTGITLFTGGLTRPNQTIAQRAGAAIRMRASAVREEFRRGGWFQRLSLRYIHAMLTQVSQRAVCNGFHSMEQRLACWLLMAHDRLGSEKLLVTQEFVSHLLGVRREGISMTIGSFRIQGLIICQRGHITIADRAGLEMRACECYRIIKREYDRLTDLSASIPRLAKAAPLYI
jgi:CRP-like cAMP-binding protein